MHLVNFSCSGIAFVVFKFKKIGGALPLFFVSCFSVEILVVFSPAGTHVISVIRYCSKPELYCHLP